MPEVTGKNDPRCTRPRRVIRGERGVRVGMPGVLFAEIPKVHQLDAAFLGHSEHAADWHNGLLPYVVHHDSRKSSDDPPRGIEWNETFWFPIAFSFPPLWSRRALSTNLELAGALRGLDALWAWLGPEPLAWCTWRPIPLHDRTRRLDTWRDFEGRTFDEVRFVDGFIQCSGRELARLWRCAWNRGDLVAALRPPLVGVLPEAFEQRGCGPFGDAAPGAVDERTLLWESLDVLTTFAPDPLTKELREIIDLFGGSGVSIKDPRLLTARRALRLMRKPVPVRRLERAPPRLGQHWTERLVGAVLELLHSTPKPPDRAWSCTMSPLWNSTASELSGCEVPAYVVRGVVYWLWRRLTASRGGRGRVGVRRACQLLTDPLKLAKTIDDRQAAKQICDWVDGRETSLRKIRAKRAQFAPTLFVGGPFFPCASRN